MASYGDGRAQRDLILFIAGVWLGFIGLIYLQERVLAGEANS